MRSKPCKTPETINANRCRNEFMLAPWIDGRCGYHSIYSQEQAFKDLVAAQPRRVFRGYLLMTAVQPRTLILPDLALITFGHRSSDRGNHSCASAADTTRI